MPAPFTSDREWTFGVEPDELWERLAATDDYREWWPWLRHFDPDGGIVTGSAWRCEVAPPLPYVVRFTIHFDRVRRHQFAEATVDGDIHGEAQLRLSNVRGGGTKVRLVSSLQPTNPLLKGVGRVARPLVGWGHDWVLDQGRRQFLDRAGIDDGGFTRG